jgi:hypothetical protein
LAPGYDIAQFYQTLFASSEYGAKKKTNRIFVTDVYAAVLRRAPQPDGLQFWVGTLDGGASKQQVIAGIVGSSEFQSGIVPQLSFLK